MSILVCIEEKLADQMSSTRKLNMLESHVKVLHEGKSSIKVLMNGKLSFKCPLIKKSHISKLLWKKTQQVINSYVKVLVVGKLFVRNLILGT